MSRHVLTVSGQPSADPDFYDPIYSAVSQVYDSFNKLIILRPFYDADSGIVAKMRTEDRESAEELERILKETFKHSVRHHTE